MSPRTSRSATRYEPVARHGALSAPHPLRHLLVVLAAVVVVVLVSGAAVGGFYVWNAARALDQNSVALGDEAALPPTIGEIEGGVNLLVVGTDSCEGQDVELFPRCTLDDSPGERNDVTMLVHISDEPRRVTVISFPRDMVVPIPSCTDEAGTTYGAMSAQMINTSYMYGGLPCTVATVEELTGVDIQFAAAMRWTGVINMSDAIGGVDVCVSDDISDGHTGLNLTAGEHTLVGAEALQFLRIRHGIGDGSDLGRISNQQQFMSSMVRTLQSDGVLNDPATLLHLANTAVSQVTTGQIVLSSGLANPTRMVQIAMAVKDVAYEDIVFVQYPTEYAPGGARVLPITYAADELFAALEANVPIKVTGAASGGNGVEVVGEAGEDGTTETATPSETPEPTDTADAGTETPTPGATEATDGTVDLPSVITGQSAAQVTCTVAQQ